MIKNEVSFTRILLFFQIAIYEIIVKNSIIKGLKYLKFSIFLYVIELLSYTIYYKISDWTPKK